MATIDLRTFSDNEFVLHFGGRPSEVDAFTFANSLLAISEALRAINREISPDTSVEIAIDAVGTGSFRARIKKTKRGDGSLLKTLGKEIGVTLLAALIAEKALHHPTQIIVKDDSYVIESDGDRVILPREVYDAKERLKHPQEIDQHLSRAFEVMEEDHSVTDFGITHSLEDERPAISIPRADFARLSSPIGAEPSDPNHRTVMERTKLVVLRAVLERSSRKWQFAWNGIRISAPIKDASFFERLANREYVFGQGDVLDVLLAIHQKRDDISGAYINDHYEVMEVTSHTPGPRQLSMVLSPHK